MPYPVIRIVAIRSPSPGIGVTTQGKSAGISGKKPEKHSRPGAQNKGWRGVALKRHRRGRTRRLDGLIAAGGRQRTPWAWDGGCAIPSLDVRQYPLDDVGVLDAGHDPHRATAVLTGLDVYSEHALLPPDPGHRSAWIGAGSVSIGGFAPAAPGRRDLRAPAAVRCKYTA